MSQKDLKYLAPIPTPFTPVNAVVKVGDTVVQAIAKIQGQINALLGSH